MHSQWLKRSQFTHPLPYFLYNFCSEGKKQTNERTTSEVIMLSIIISTNTFLLLEKSTHFKYRNTHFGKCVFAIKELGDIGKIKKGRIRQASIY